MERLHTRPYHGPSHKPRITYDERRNETYVPTEIQREIDAADEIREQLRQYVESALEDGREPSASGFITENTKPWRKYTDDFEELAEKVIAQEVAKIKR